MEKHLLFFDIDGTLLFRGRMPWKVARSIKRAQAAGHYCILNTGRPQATLPKSVMRQVKWDGMVCGASIVIFRGEKLACSLMSEESVRKILEVTEKRGLPIIFDCDGPCYGLHLKSIKKQFASVDEVFENFAEKHIYKLEIRGDLSEETLRELGEYAAFYKMGTYIDVFVLGNSKATGMQVIGEKTGIPRERMIAFGDNNNDLDMLRYAGKSVAMKVASEDAVNAAMYHASKHRLGVCEGIRHYLAIQ